MRKVEENFMRVKSRLSLTDEAKKRGNKSKVKAITQPKLEISQFDRYSDDWIHFRDQFKATIRTNADLQDVQKLGYLLSFLKDEAKNE
jgi:Protein of unknown function (DUF1759)